MSKRSFWSDCPMAPPDKILGLTEAFKADPNPKKINLGVGAYRDDKGKPYVLGSIKEAEKRLYEKSLDKEYSPITGIADFNKYALEFAYGEDSEALKSKRVASTQSISGTGACRLAGEFIKTFMGNVDIHIPTPTWGNHFAIYKNAGLNPVQYNYYDKAANGLNFDGMVKDIRAAKNGSVFMFHACAHNPTGCDPTRAQWDELSAIVKEKEHLVFFDCAYQSFASGNANDDAYALRKFVADGHQVMLAQSFAKNFGLYGERVGLFSIVTSSSEEAQRVVSQVKLLVRAMYSNPPIHGARLVTEVLSDPALKAQWQDECKGMADRIQEMRVLLRSKLEAGAPGRSWSHVTDQIGMFCYTGLTVEQVLKMRSEYSVYCTDDGRFSMAGINSGNIDDLAAAVIAVL